MISAPGKRIGSGKTKLTRAANAAITNRISDVTMRFDAPNMLGGFGEYAAEVANCSLETVLQFDRWLPV